MIQLKEVEPKVQGQVSKSELLEDEVKEKECLIKYLEQRF
tara:strand:- start:89 stop:208 length:120 start_codon:yes stop_codon:yes gene_type:complete